MMHKHFCYGRDDQTQNWPELWNESTLNYSFCELCKDWQKLPKLKERRKKLKNLSVLSFWYPALACRILCSVPSDLRVDCLSITEDHGILEVENNHWSLFWTIFPSKHSNKLPRQLLSISKDGECTTSVSNLCQWPITLKVQKVSWCPEETSCISVCSHCLFCCCCTLLEEAWLSLLVHLFRCLYTLARCLPSLLFPTT